MTDLARCVMFKEMFAPCVVYSVNNCTDEVRNGAVEYKNELNKDVNHHTLVPILK